MRTRTPLNELFGPSLSFSLPSTITPALMLPGHRGRGEDSSVKVLPPKPDCCYYYPWGGPARTSHPPPCPEPQGRVTASLQPQSLGYSTASTRTGNQGPKERESNAGRETGHGRQHPLPRLAGIATASWGPRSLVAPDPSAHTLAQPQQLRPPPHSTLRLTTVKPLT